MLTANTWHVDNDILTFPIGTTCSPAKYFARDMAHVDFLASQPGRYVVWVCTGTVLFMIGACEPSEIQCHATWLEGCGGLPACHLTLNWALLPLKH